MYTRQHKLSYNRATSPIIGVIRRLKKQETVAIDGRLLGSTSQHFSNIIHMSSLINKQCSRLGRAPATTDRMTLASHLMCEKGMDPVKICQPSGVSLLRDNNGYTHFDYSHSKCIYVHRLRHNWSRPVFTITTSGH